MKTEYCVGFLFDGLGNVLLIRKERPDWQKGWLNGVGGHIEAGESPSEAMCREFQEEAKSVISTWNLFSSLEGEGFKVYFFWAVLPLGEIDNAPRTITDEELVWCRVDKLRRDYKTLPNIQWLVPMAESMHKDRAAWFEIKENY